MLYYSYGFLTIHISILYITGYIINFFSLFFIIYLLSKYNRKILCLYCIAFGSLGCLLKCSDKFFILFIGRLFDGLSMAFLVIPFQQWLILILIANFSFLLSIFYLIFNLIYLRYGHEHMFSFDFPKEWLSYTFNSLTIISSFLSVLAGFTDRLIENILPLKAFPFFIAIIFQILGISLKFFNFFFNFIIIFIKYCKNSQAIIK